MAGKIWPPGLNFDTCGLHNVLQCTFWAYLKSIKDLRCFDASILLNEEAFICSGLEKEMRQN